MYSLIFVKLTSKNKLMRIHFLGALFICFVLLSCSQKKEKENDNKIIITKPSVTKISEKDISKFNFIEYNLDSKTEKEIENWSQYKELEALVTQIKKGDLSYFKNNNEAITTFAKDFKEKIPDTIKTLSVNARVTALETKLFKLENIYNLSSTSKDELSQAIKEFLESVSNLNLQMNKKLEKDSQIIEVP